VIKLRKIRWGRTCSTHRRDENTNNIFVENLKRRDHTEELVVDESIILE
jgi:hypothetical protein